MLSSVTLHCQVTMIVMNSGSQLSEMSTISHKFTSHVKSLSSFCHVFVISFSCLCRVSVVSLSCLYRVSVVSVSCLTRSWVTLWQPMNSHREYRLVSRLLYMYIAASCFPGYANQTKSLLSVFDSSGPPAAVLARTPGHVMCFIYSWLMYIFSDVDI